MLVFTRAMKMAAAAVSLAVMLLGAATPSQAQTTGHVRLHIVKVGFIIGVGGGSGVLFYHGHRYRLAISGIGPVNQRWVDPSEPTLRRWPAGGSRGIRLA